MKPFWQSYGRQILAAWGVCLLAILMIVATAAMIEQIGPGSVSVVILSAWIALTAGALPLWWRRQWSRLRRAA
ncbi:MAG: hypothetical protein KC635_10920 [Myxococcales bacterium]|nr:hypothetical protein [Myxococcales bacterium]MCB9731697.1 hypothetical protein [Deltaproteobacteria bacterium]